MEQSRMAASSSRDSNDDRSSDDCSLMVPSSLAGENVRKDESPARRSTSIAQDNNRSTSSDGSSSDEGIITASSSNDSSLSDERSSDQDKPSAGNTTTAAIPHEEEPTVARLPLAHDPSSLFPSAYAPEKTVTRMPPMPRRPDARIPNFSHAYPMRDNKNEAMRRYRMQGIQKIKVGRYERRRKRAALRSTTKTTHDDNVAQSIAQPGAFRPADWALSSSSGSESSVHEGGGFAQRWTNETIDFWDLEREVPEWGEQSLFGIIPVPETSRLVGWATHCQHDGESFDSSGGDDHQHRHKRPRHNPLFFLPNTPLPPSHLNYVSNTMANTLSERKASVASEPQDQGWKRKTSLGHNDSDEDNPMPKGKKNAKQSANVRTLPDELHESFDCSALVAVGMVWEEMVTASLLPLARQYVDRCRDMGMRSSDDVATAEAASAERWTDLRPDSFRDWTLPPEEALLKLVTDSDAPVLRSLFLPSASTPLWRCQATALPQHAPSRDYMQRVSVKGWCRRHGLDPSFVLENMDVFEPFIPCKPDRSLGEATSRRQGAS